MDRGNLMLWRMQGGLIHVGRDITLRIVDIDQSNPERPIVQLAVEAFVDGAPVEIGDVRFRVAGIELNRNGCPVAKIEIAAPRSYQISRGEYPYERHLELQAALDEQDPGERARKRRTAA